MYSKKILSMSQEQKEVYMTALYDAGMLWGKGLPIIQEHLQHFNYDKRDYDVVFKGCSKQLLEVPLEHQYLNIHEPAVYAMLNQIDKDFYYANRGRISEKKQCCIEGFIEMLGIRYGLSLQAISDIQFDIMNPIDDEIISPYLVDALDFREKFQF
jgi:hypothetical protein